MSQTDDQTSTSDQETGATYREYILGVRIVERETPGGGRCYRFEAPEHGGIEFADPETATLYADVYFDVNGFEEAGTGERGVPPVVIAAGRDTLAAYFLTMPGIDVHWVASFYGHKPEKVQRYANRVRKRATQIRDGAREQGHA
ncbi:MULTISPECIES: hypothetical protein [Haloarcula]|uniref:hypothetical protein n=1 Tax=Haloarcula TaxID=2237 RepID=UPI0023ED50FC|nr:hypothetical protein [Halomicroarcula sp. XH51]